jgi:mitochondrial-processing peptidase subunit beta
VVAPAKFIASDLRVRNDDQDEAHMVLASEGVSWTSPDYFPMLVAQSVIGAWDRTLGGGANLSSRLAQTVAANKFANRFMAFNTCYSDTGLFGVYMVSSERAHLDDLIYLVQQEIVRLSQSATDAEVARARNQLKTNLLLQLDGTTPVCEDIGRQVLTYGRRMTPFEIDARIEAVDAAAVRRVVYKYMYDRDPALVGIGPVEGMPDYNRVQTATSWLRV